MGRRFRGIRVENTHTHTRARWAGLVAACLTMLPSSPPLLACVFSGYAGIACEKRWLCCPFPSMRVSYGHRPLYDHLLYTPFFLLVSFFSFFYLLSYWTFSLNDLYTHSIESYSTTHSARLCSKLNWAETAHSAPFSLIEFLLLLTELRAFLFSTYSILFIFPWWIPSSFFFLHPRALFLTGGYCWRPKKKVTSIWSRRLTPFVIQK